MCLSVPYWVKRCPAAPFGEYLPVRHTGCNPHFSAYFSTPSPVCVRIVDHEVCRNEKPMIKLEKFEFGDIARLISWIPDEEFLMQWAGPQYSFPLTPEQVGVTYRDSQTKVPKNYMFKVIEKSSDDVIGHVELIKVDRGMGSATLARVLVGEETLRGKGYGRDAIEKTLDFAFKKLKLREVELGVYSFNKPAISLYKKLGFKKYKEVTYETDFDARFHHIVRMKLEKASWNSDRS